MLMMTMAVALSATALAKNPKLESVCYTTSPEMRCEKCENKIKQNVRFAKGNGVKEIQTDLSAQTVIVKYKPGKTTEEDIKTEFKKIGYDVEKVEVTQKEVTQKKKK